MLNFIDEIPLHVVVAQEPNTKQCILITAYIPDVDMWDNSFKFKIKK